MRGITLATKGYIVKGFGKRIMELTCPLEIEVDVEVESLVDVERELDISVEVEEPTLETEIEGCDQ